MLNFSQYRVEQSLVIQNHMLQRDIATEPSYYLGIYLIGYYTNYLRIIGADEVFIKEISELMTKNYSDTDLNKIIDEMVAKNQTEHNDY